MKAKEREKARVLRSQGLSLNEIAARIDCSKSSVSAWVRDIPLTKKQIEVLKSSQDLGRAKAALHPNSPRLKWARIREEILGKAKREISNSCSLKELKYVGTSLYWAEGYNASRNCFVFANSDPRMISLMMLFLFRVCKISSDKLRGKVNIHPSLDIKAAERYWSKISGISRNQFYRPLLAISKASKQKRRTLPYGTFQIIISDVVLCSKIKGWIEGIKNWAVSSVG